ncbi:MAG: mechanosensitive ion channel protein MscS [Anaerolineaceae bacterium 4572_78]|nr:MAG: mechanosensitive ion channel protein MscS [Anaerolineaceae bacterium 4572_78]
MLEWLDINPVTQGKLLNSIGIITFFWLIHIVASWVTKLRTSDVYHRHNLRKMSRYGATFISIILIGRVWFENIESLATFLGLFTAGVAIALKDLLTNFAGWIFIMWRRPFEVGDRIQIGEHAGDVIDIRVFEFVMLEIGNWVDADQSTGRILHIPNGKVTIDTLANYSKGFDYIWNEIFIRVTFESNWKKAKRILLDIVNRDTAGLSPDASQHVAQASHRYPIFYSKLTPIVYTRIDTYGIILTIRYLCLPRRRRSSEHKMWENIIEQFAINSDIEFAYPTQRFYHRNIERQNWIDILMGKDDD